MHSDEYYMQLALEEARRAGEIGEVPVGAIVVKDDIVIASAHNIRENSACPYGHAEFLALAQASEYLGVWRLTGCKVYVTLEPCLMCAGLMNNARIDACIYGAFDPKAGALGTLYNVQSDNRLNHSFEVVPGVLEQECADVLKEFFKVRRERNKELKKAGIQEKQSEKLNELGALRAHISSLDSLIQSALLKRYAISQEIGRYKLKNKLPIQDKEREQVILNQIHARFEEPFNSYITQIWKLLMEQSRSLQDYPQDQD